ncbi:SH3 domain-containing protein [Streptomyces sp. NPDC088766]|uniref:SH3 domain-containing protein n=1 Tax=Streptomyces sp. NPDC088766 TaxID=3365893 RepID=UPI00382A15A1
MPLRSALTRFAIARAAGTLAAAAAVTPATAAAVTPATASEGGQGSTHRQTPRLYKGVVTANKLLRNAPNRGGKVVRVAFRDDLVTVHCRTTGQKVDGNSQW